MDNRNSKVLEKAKAYAFLLLKFRLRSEKELAGRLKQKKFSPQVIEEVVSFLREKQFLDDSLFAKSWLESRLNRSLGLRRIKQELKIKGIDNQTVESLIAEKKNDYSEEETVLTLAKEKIRRIKGTDPVSAKRRVYAFLIRRGFSPDIVSDAIKQI